MSKQSDLENSISKWVVPAKEPVMRVLVSKELHLKLQLLSNSTGVPIITITNMLIELGLPNLTKEELERVRKARVKYVESIYPKGNYA